jgi:hypothetical protein
MYMYFLIKYRKPANKKVGYPNEEKLLVCRGRTVSSKIILWLVKGKSSICSKGLNNTFSIHFTENCTVDSPTENYYRC